MANKRIDHEADAKIADLVYENVRLKAERDDLATRLSEYLCDSTGGLLSKTGYDVRTMVAHTEEYYDRVHAEEREEVEAERDAALAAIERVRELVEEWRYGIPEYTSSHYQEGQKDQQRKLVGQLLAALDGAPEPEWEWAVSVPGDGEPFSDVYQTREHLAEQETGIAWGEEQLVRRRKAGPWEPVEGEKP